MVIKRHYHREPGGPPPPMDESWWEAVLAEEEARYELHNAKGSRNPEHNDEWESLEAGEEVSSILDWQMARYLYEQDQVVELLVTGFNRGGLLVNGNNIHGFVPVSHLIEAPCKEMDLETWLETYNCRKLNLKVIECDEERGRVVFSERAAQSMPGSRKQLLASLCPGSSVVGIVTNITDFGIFVDLGGIEGLVHVSEISWGRVHHPTDVVSLNQQVQVYVIYVDQERARIALSLKRLHPNPWETAEERYLPGQLTEAVITSIVSFGAFARLEEGLDGLIHLSEFRTSVDNDSTASILNVGQRVQVRVLHVDSAKQRLGLSLDLSGGLLHSI